MVPKGSSNKQLAYDFIAITMKKDIQNLLANNGGVPVAADPPVSPTRRTRSSSRTTDTLADADGLGFYPDWPAPGYYDVLVAGTQKLMNGSSTPAQVLDSFAKPYDENLSSVGH